MRLVNALKIGASEELGGRNTIVDFRVSIWKYLWLFVLFDIVSNPEERYREFVIIGNEKRGFLPAEL